MFTITLCCSKKFKKQEREFAKKLRLLGVNVYEPPLDSAHDWIALSEIERLAMAAGFTHRHFFKISKSDGIFVLNIGGYIGNSVNLEIGYAAALNKKIYFMEDDTEEYTRRILIDGIAKTPKQLVERIKQVKTPDLLD